MTKHKFLPSANEIIESSMIPVFYHDDIEICEIIVNLCFKAGVKAFEFTNRGEKALVNFTQLRKHVDKEAKGMLLGIGSIVNAESALKFIQLGADFIVSPIYNSEVARVCNLAHKMFIPGCATPTEIFNATQTGSEIIKIFPAESIGHQFASNILGPMPWLKLMPTGGIEPNEENLEKWFKAGVVCVGMGSQLLKKEWIENKNFEVLGKNIADTLMLANRLRLKYNKQEA